MALSIRVAATLAAAAAAAIAFAPIAAADDDDIDNLPGTDRGASQQSAGPDDDDLTAAGPARKAPKPDSVNDVPKGWSNEALWSDQAGGGSNPFGSLPKPPVFALD